MWVCRREFDSEMWQFSFYVVILLVALLVPLVVTLLVTLLVTLRKLKITHIQISRYSSRFWSRIADQEKRDQKRDIVSLFFGA